MDKNKNNTNKDISVSKDAFFKLLNKSATASGEEEVGKKACQTSDDCNEKQTRQRKLEDTSD